MDTWGGKKWTCGPNIPEEEEVGRGARGKKRKPSLSSLMPIRALKTEWGQGPIDSQKLSKSKRRILKKKGGSWKKKKVGGKRGLVTTGTHIK